MKAGTPPARDGLPLFWLALAVVFRFAALVLWLGLAAFLAVLGLGIFLGMDSPANFSIWAIPFLAGIVTALYAVLKGACTLLISPSLSEKGVRLSMGRYPSLRGLIGEVARRLGSRLPDHVVLGMSGDFYVFQGRMRLSPSTRLKGRILVLGAPLLYMLGADELKSFLAHELAHFTGGDGLYSAHVAPVYESARAALNTLLEEFDEGTQSALAGWTRLAYIPAIVVAFIYFKGFELIDARLRRSRELRADRLACEAYGPDICASALVRGVGYGPIWDRLIAQPASDLSLLIAEDAPKAGLSRLSQHLSRHCSLAEQMVVGALLVPTQALDTHPALRDRLLALNVSKVMIGNILSREPEHTVEDDFSADEQTLVNLYAKTAWRGMRDVFR